MRRLLVKGSKFKAVELINGYDFRNLTFIVERISDDGTIAFSSEMGWGMMSHNEFDKRFKLLNKRQWTTWKSLVEGNFEYSPTFLEDGDYEYRTNGKRVEVRCIFDGYEGMKSSASCDETDEFDLETGIGLALARIAVKIAQKSLEIFEDGLNGEAERTLWDLFLS